MTNSLVIEVFVRVLFSFTRGVTEHYDPDEPEVETFGCNDSLSSEGREWNCQPVDKPIYQEYTPPSDDDYDLMSVGNSRVRYRLIDASSPDEDEDDQQNEDDEMAWKRFRPSVLRTVCQSMYIGALISLLFAVIHGLSYVMIAYVSYETTRNCQFHRKETIPVKIQWIRTLSEVIGDAFLYVPTLFVVWFVVLCRNAFSFSTVSVKECEKKTHSCCFCPVLCECSVSCCPSSLWNISFQAFCDSEDFSQHYISKQYMLESLSSKKLHPEPVEESDFMKLTTPYSFTFFVGIFIASFILSNVQQTN